MANLVWSCLFLSCLLPSVTLSGFPRELLFDRKFLSNRDVRPPFFGLSSSTARPLFGDLCPLFGDLNTTSTEARFSFRRFCFSLSSSFFVGRSFVWWPLFEQSFSNLFCQKLLENPRRFVKRISPFCFFNNW